MLMVEAAAEAVGEGAAATAAAAGAAAARSLVVPHSTVGHFDWVPGPFRKKGRFFWRLATVGPRLLAILVSMSGYE
jgi:hypothetical protein